MIYIEKRKIGPYEPCFFIAEAGVNHNGSIELAKRLIDAAVFAGADAVKFQTFKTELIVTKSAKTADYAKDSAESQEELLKRLELSENDHKELQMYARKKGIIFLSTPHSGEWSVDLLEKLHVPAYKIGSGDLDNLPFLRYVARTQKPLILSAGMSTIDEIVEAVGAVRGEGNNKIVVLQCTSSYPTDIKDANLRVMQTIAEKCDVLVGYSDHTTDILTPSIARALGAVVVEKHFTIGRKLPGPDHKASAEPQELKDTISLMRKTEVLLGSPIKSITEAEEMIRRGYRKSIVAVEDIPPGTVIGKYMLGIKRPGTGMRPKEISSLIGKKTSRIIKKDELVHPEDVV